MLNIFAKEINPDKILKLQNLQYQEKLMLQDTVPAASQRMGTVNISSLGHFYCLYITCTYTTLVIDQAAIVDNGIMYLRGKLIDGSNQRPLFNDYIPLDLYSTPGRVRSLVSTSIATDPISNNLFYPQPFQYMFTVNSEIMFDVKNDSDTTNKYTMVFHGLRFPVASRANKY